MRTRPRTPCGAATTPSRTRSPGIGTWHRNVLLARCRLLLAARRSGCLHALLRLGARQRLLGLLAALTRLDHLRLSQELGDAVRGLGADFEPVGNALLVQLDALGVLARQQRVVGAE